MSFEYRERLRLRAQEALANQIQADVQPLAETTDVVPGQVDHVPPSPTDEVVVVTDEQVQATLQIVDALDTNDDYASYMTELQRANLPLFEQVNSVLLERAANIPPTQSQPTSESAAESTSSAVTVGSAADPAVPGEQKPEAGLTPPADVKPAANEKKSRKAKNDVPATN